MTLKASEIINKVMGAGMIVASISFFAYIPAHAPYIIPGAIFGAGGFLLALKRDRHPSTDLQAQQRVEELAGSLAATQLELASTQERLDRLEEERDFMRQLAAPAQRQAAVLPPPPPPELPQPRIPEVSPPPGR